MGIYMIGKREMERKYNELQQKNIRKYNELQQKNIQLLNDAEKSKAWASTALEKLKLENELLEKELSLDKGSEKRIEHIEQRIQIEKQKYNNYIKMAEDQTIMAETYKSLAETYKNNQTIMAETYKNML